MASSAILESCGLRPPAPVRSISRIRPVTTRPKLIRALPSAPAGSRVNLARPISRDWALRVSTPLKAAHLEEDNYISNIVEEDSFDPGSPPPFGLAEIRAAIPKHCWVKDTWRSMSYVVRDVAVVAGLAVAAAHINSWAVWPLYWIAQGTMFWALFVLGHDWYDEFSLETLLLDH